MHIFCSNESIFVDFWLDFFFARNLNKLRIKYRWYPKSTKIDAFQPKYMHMYNPSDDKNVVFKAEF